MNKQKKTSKIEDSVQTEPTEKDKRWNKMLEDLAYCSATHQYIKEQSMIYQRGDKVSAAEWKGLPFNSYFDLPYEDWAKIRTEYYSFLEDERQKRICELN